MLMALSSELLQPRGDATLHFECDAMQIWVARSRSMPKDYLDCHRETRIANKPHNGTKAAKSHHLISWPVRK